NIFSRCSPKRSSSDRPPNPLSIHETPSSGRDASVESARTARTRAESQENRTLRRARQSNQVRRTQRLDGRREPTEISLGEAAAEGHPRRMRTWGRLVVETAALFLAACTGGQSGSTGQTGVPSPGYPSAGSTASPSCTRSQTKPFDLDAETPFGTPREA